MAIPACVPQGPSHPSPTGQCCTPGAGFLHLVVYTLCIFRLYPRPNCHGDTCVCTPRTITPFAHWPMLYTRGRVLALIVYTLYMVRLYLRPRCHGDTCVCLCVDSHASLCVPDLQISTLLVTYLIYLVCTCLGSNALYIGPIF